MTTPDQVLSESVQRAVSAVAAALAPVSKHIDSDPHGIDAVVMAAALRAYADVIEHGFGEGNAMGPLKTAVDEIRGRLLSEFLKQG
jgi:hypothetical protein